MSVFASLGSERERERARERRKERESVCETVRVNQCVRAQEREGESTREKVGAFVFMFGRE